MKIKNRKKDVLQNFLKSAIPKRFIVTFLGFWGIFFTHCMRVNVSVAIVAMVNHTATTISNKSNLIGECPRQDWQQISTQEHLKGARYNWDLFQQGLILSAFFYGYLITMIPGGYIAQKFGAVRIFGISVFSTALFTLLTPLFVGWGVVPFVVLRFLEGLGEGPTYPSIIAILSRWSPKMERSRMTSIILAGSSLGSMLSFPISGLLSSSDFLGGWPSVFYVFGGLSCIWYLFWVLFIYESPYIHPSIYQEEVLKFKDNDFTSNKILKLPWKRIITSVPFWAVNVASVGITFGINVVYTEIPTYLSTILHFNVKESGSLAALPYIAQALGAYVSGFTADKMRASDVCGITNIRKIFNSIASFGPSICLVLITFSGCQAVTIVSMLCLGMFLSGCKFSGYVGAAVDMSPDFAGVMFGVTNGLGSINGILAPTVAGAIINNGSTIANWSKVFYITAGIYILGAIVFIAFGSSDLQPWGKAEPENDKQEETKF